ncbi:ExbD/TolR family protein [Pseudemcibacter aquimaris]|uniref:ExbD/TolR family protein n=1 Tax=Pseudemcibacter aquimaris TaxID=2857064 RepID=UPI002012D881|nr:biopolymer transporter ExbD [Pseudemcibacter aquimaris]MCC3861499.1 biopolymer transporter ExbD [Pseudemcibacter aquimaris]WDU58268.1 biopolymer transporter ExbD [Pseudemcibacter aquimaris]
MKRRLFLNMENKPSEINISPLIDIVFILLIFFIVTTVFFEETGVEVNKPQAISQQDLESKSIMIAITADGQVFYGGRNIGVVGVRNLVRRMSSREAQPVILQADAQVPTELLIKVLDEAKLGGASNVNVSTRTGG